jgi:protein-S-isoprenylcysteine O-methyltransferase Ste14
MKWTLIAAYPLWFKLGVCLLLLLDVFLILRHFKAKREDALELLARISGSNFFGFYLLYRLILKLNDVALHPKSQTWQGWLQWSVIVIPFAIFFWSYLFRKPALCAANRMREIIFPFFCALLPFAVYESSSLVHGMWVHKTPWIRQILKPFYPGGFEIYDGLSYFFILIGDLIALWALFYLKSSFSIMSEVRDWVNRGPYQWIRHPMYLGEIFATMGFCLLKFSYLNLFLTLLFVICISLRARFEEEKIRKIYPAYDAYRSKTGFLVPRWKAL